MTRGPAPIRWPPSPAATALLAAAALLLFVALVAASAALVAWLTQPLPPPDLGPLPERTPSSAADHLALGNPSGATPDPADRDNLLLAKPYFALSYNDAKATPNWVSWCLRAADLGDAPRFPFRGDPGLPPRFYRVTPKDYSGTGFDRGHMCPRSDRSANADMSNSTFVMTNIVPQAPHVNQWAWEQLETYCRDLVRKGGKTLHIVAGPQGRGGEGSAGRRDTIAGGRVVVPERCWKVILAVDAGPGDADPARVTAAARAVAVVMPNDQSVTHAWGPFRVPVRAVEDLTGYTFWDKVPPDVAHGLKQKADRTPLPPPTPRRWDAD